MLTPEQVDGLACRGSLSFICCLPREKLHLLAGWIEGMGPATMDRLYDTACCNSTPPAPPKAKGKCSDGAASALCAILDDSWLADAGMLAAFINDHAADPTVRVLAGIVSKAADAAKALCVDKSVTAIQGTAICTLILYADQIVAAVESYPLIGTVVRALLHPQVLPILVDCCGGAP